MFGPIALTQMVLPGMRAQRWGKVVNIGSMGGRLTFPGAGLYHATKYSLEAISDALRFEVKGFGIDVVLIEPGLIMTEFAATAVAKAGEAAPRMVLMPSSTPRSRRSPRVSTKARCATSAAARTSSRRRSRRRSPAAARRRECR